MKRILSLIFLIFTANIYPTQTINYQIHNRILSQLNDHDESINRLKRVHLLMIDIINKPFSGIVNFL